MTKENIIGRIHDLLNSIDNLDYNEVATRYSELILELSLFEKQDFKFEQAYVNHQNRLTFEQQVIERKLRIESLNSGSQFCTENGHMLATKNDLLSFVENLEGKLN